MTPTLLTAEQLRVGYEGRPLLPPLSFAIHRNEYWAVVGPNGAGKSTLLKTLLGVLPLVSGSFTLARQDTLGYVPQRTSINNHAPLRVVDLVRSGRDRGWSFLDPRAGRAQRDVVRKAMIDTQVESLARHKFGTLSEGQKQRVLVARALASAPDLLVLDEPTASMDAAAALETLNLIDRLRQERGLGVLLVTHQVAEADRATHTIELDKDRGFAAVRSNEGHDG